MMDTPSAPPSDLVSYACVVLADPRAILGRLRDHIAEYLPVERDDRGARFLSDFGTVRADVGEGALDVSLRGADEAGLSVLKEMVVGYLLAFVEGEGPAVRWSGDGKVGQLLPYFREMRVVSVSNVTPLMRRVVLAGHDLGRFTIGGLHVRLLFPPVGIAAPQWPVNGDNGRPQWPQGEARPAARIYTIRHIDADGGELTIDMVLHDSSVDEHAPGAGFALNARPGDIVGMTGPGGGAIGASQRYILLGDETALPAIARMLEAMPAFAQTAVFIEVADAAEEQALPSAARVELNWLHHDGAAAGTTDFLKRSVRAHLWLSDGGDTPFVWAGCEHAQARAIRQFLLKEAGLSRDKCLSATYWRRGVAGDDARQD